MCHSSKMSFILNGLYALTFLTSLVSSLPRIPEHSAQTLEYYSDIKPEGSYQYGFKTDNNIHVQQTGIQSPVHKEPSLLVQGSFHYETPEGQPIHLTYTADENGFHPQGDHLPTPPPIPPQILKALAWIEAQNKKKPQTNKPDGIKESFFGNNYNRF